MYEGQNDGKRNKAACFRRSAHEDGTVTGTDGTYANMANDSDKPGTARASARTARFSAFALLTAVAAGSGCTEGFSPLQSAAADVNPAAWQEAAELVIPNADTLSLRDLTVFLRCNDRFAEDTLTVRIAFRTPDSLRFEEPFTLAVPRPAAPAALTHEAGIPYRRRVRFGRTGDYRIRITPSRPVRGVEAVGIDISTSE